MTKIFAALSILTMTTFAQAGDRLVCAGGNQYWGGGIFVMNLYGRYCEFEQFTGNHGLVGSDSNTRVQYPGDKQQYMSLVNCENYDKLKRDEQGLYATIRYPALGHGSIPASEERIRCKLNPQLPISLDGLKYSEVITAVSP